MSTAKAPAAPSDRICEKHCIQTVAIVSSHIQFFISCQGSIRVLRVHKDHFMQTTLYVR